VLAAYKALLANRIPVINGEVRVVSAVPAKKNSWFTGQNDDANNHETFDEYNGEQGDDFGGDGQHHYHDGSGGINFVGGGGEHHHHGGGGNGDLGGGDGGGGGFYYS